MNELLEAKDCNCFTLLKLHCAKPGVIPLVVGKFLLPQSQEMVVLNNLSDTSLKADSLAWGHGPP